MSTIRQRLTWRLLAGWCALLVIGGLAAYLTTRAALTRQFDSALRTKAVALSMVIEQDDSGRVVLDASDQIMRDYDAEVTTAFFELWKADGTLLARSPSLHEGKLPLRQQASETLGYWNLTMPGGLAVRAVGLKFEPHPADESNKPARPLETVLVVATDRRDLDRALTTLAMVTAGSDGLVLALTAAVVPWLLRKELQPLNRLTEQAQRITAETLTERFATEGLPEELTPISRRLNDLLERLQASFERERQFGDNLAHEFRTPIAELRSLAELSLKWPDTRNSGTDCSVLEIALQMEGIINHLLTIARSENGKAPAESGAVKPAALLTSLCQSLQQKAAARNLTIDAKIPPEMEIRTEPARLRSILTNLLNNAVEYSRPGGTVQIQGEGGNGRFALSVINPVENLSPEDVPHLFERFWRKDAARSGGEHSGLGLSLARAFANSLGFTLSAAFEGDGQLRMTLSGPAGPEHSPRTISI
jgi:two-component system sensor histidine kinase QseC